MGAASRGRGPITGDNVRLLRGQLLAELRREETGQPAPGRVDVPRRIAELVGDLTSAEIRTGLAWMASLCRARAELSSADTRLWIETAGLRGTRVSVREMAGYLGLSARQAHRRIRRVDDVVAAALDGLPPGEFPRLARPADPGSRTDTELLETARAESYLAPEPKRALDAVRMYRRNRGTAPREQGRPAYLDSNKDVRYRDAKRVARWIKAIATDPPLMSTSTTEDRTLTICHGVELATDPHEALAQINRAIWTRQRDLLPLLLAHAGRLIPDTGAAGVDAWLSYLQVRYHAAMESEHIVALRYARALQADAARHSPRGIADPRVRRGISGRGHILQMFGHYDAALHCFAQAVRHAAHFPPDGGEQSQDAHDAHAQLVYTEALRHGDRSRAGTALRRMHVLADQHGDRIKIQFIRERRALELLISFAARRQDLVLAPPSGRHVTVIENQFRRFTELARDHPAPNRLLAAQDITLLYAVLTRDAGVAAEARDAFQRINDETGGYSNLTDRFNSRLRAAKSLSRIFRSVPEVTGPADPLRDPLATPTHTTGLLVRHG